MRQLKSNKPAVPSPKPCQNFHQKFLDSYSGDSGTSGQNLLEQARYDIKAEKVPATEFFAGLFEPTPYSVVIHPDVGGVITLDVKQVTVLEVVDIITEIYGYEVRQRGSVFSIFPSWTTY